VGSLYPSVISCLPRTSPSLEAGKWELCSCWQVATRVSVNHTLRDITHRVTMKQPVCSVDIHDLTASDNIIRGQRERQERARWQRVKEGWGEGKVF